MSKNKCDFREAEIGGLWSTSNENIFNGNLNFKLPNGEEVKLDVLLVRNLNKNNNTKYPEFRLYNQNEYTKVLMAIEMDKKKTEKNLKQEKLNRKESDSCAFNIEVEDIDF